MIARHKPGRPVVESIVMADGDVPEYYELLQISPNAEAETVHRVYRLLAARYHPDNPHTGNWVVRVGDRG